MQPDTPILLIVDGRPEVAIARARTLQDEAGEALSVQAATTMGEALDLARGRPGDLVGVVAENDLLPGVSGLDLLARLRREVPHARRILVARDLARASREPEYARVDAAFEMRGPFHELASGIVVEALGSERAREKRGRVPGERGTRLGTTP